MSRKNVVINATEIVTKIAERQISKYQGELYLLRKRANEAHTDEKRIRDTINKARAMVEGLGGEGNIASELNAFLGKLGERRRAAAASAASLANEIRTHRTVIKLMGGIISANVELERDIRAAQEALAKETLPKQGVPAGTFNVSQPLSASQNVNTIREQLITMFGPDDAYRLFGVR